MAFEREIEVCRGVALRAGELALQHAARGVRREDKADDSPVTVADRECEQLIVSELRRAFPGDGFVGEEGGFVGMSTFGASGPEAELFRHFGITPEAVVAEVVKRLPPARAGRPAAALEVR